ncbi:hypothetical protein [Tuwongella immobilis]|uniref:Uncharacterized protein n=1 Tax=Tuwongella immobilis TaxID=692036 RepID=A0A6C2YMW0_9BACT|nr:hypothetical protein [Tuwongella immobilis]VIP02405.1 unnamed protein product [Tuwongella immobilis]VTS01301.1 unnamed protein product [Tuwongella immobilis]
MIQLPRRSVTRFFVPLIDVLILLFCIFLLMPFVSQPASDDVTTDGTRQAPPPDLVTVLQQLEQAQRELIRLRNQASLSLAESIAVKVLEIDKTNGRLYHVDTDRLEVRDQRDAQRLIDAHTRKSGSKEPFFLILYPRELSGYPEQQQVEQYRRWFQHVPHGFDNPLAGP